MSLLSLRDVSLSFGAAPLLDRVNFSLDRGERVCVVGRNGEGKSTLLKVVEGIHLPDSGEIVRQGGLVMASLPQEVPVTLTGSVFDVVADGLGEVAGLLSRYHALNDRCYVQGDESVLDELGGRRRRWKRQVAGSWTRKCSRCCRACSWMVRPTLPVFPGGASVVCCWRVRW
jgi:ATP-binding cassette subfamily F protein uup